MDNFLPTVAKLANFMQRRCSFATAIPTEYHSVVLYFKIVRSTVLRHVVFEEKNDRLLVVTFLDEGSSYQCERASAVEGAVCFRYLL